MTSVVIVRDTEAFKTFSVQSNRYKKQPILLSYYDCEPSIFFIAQPNCTSSFFLGLPLPHSWVIATHAKFLELQIPLFAQSNLPESKACAWG